MTYKLIDLAGFNPAEQRAGGKWTAGGGSAKKAPAKPVKPAKKGPSQHQKLLIQRAGLALIEKNLRAQIAALQPGKKAGQPGKKAGQAGAHKGAKGTKKSGGKASGHSAGKPQTLAQQIASMQKTIVGLRATLAALKLRKARSARRAK